MKKQEEKIVDNSRFGMEVEEFKSEALSQYNGTYIPADSSQEEESKPASVRSNHSDQGNGVPSFQRITKQKIEMIKPTPTKYQVQQYFNELANKNQLKLSKEVYNRFGGVNKTRGAMPRVLKDEQLEIEKTIEKAMQWKQDPNKEYRIYANKIAPRFRSREQEVRYYEKRLAAKAFCERGYGLGKVKEQYSQNGGPVNMQKRRYKTVSTAFISEAYRRFQLFLSQDMHKSIRPLTGPEMRSLYSVLLNAQSNFQPDQYHCFRKCVKIAFDLGSVSIYQQNAVSLFIAVLLHLKQRVLQGDKYEKEMSEVGLVKGNNRLLDIYAPVEGGGYQQRQTDISVMSEAISIDPVQLAEQLQWYAT